MKFIKAIAILILTSILLTGCSSALKNKDGSKGTEENKYKVGDILDAPEKTASFDKITEITIYEESEDKSYTSVTSMKKTDGYTVYSAKQNLKDGTTIKSVTYQIGDKYTGYRSVGNEWHMAEDDPKLAITSFAYKGFDTETPLVTNGYEKLEDTVIDGREHYTYKVSVTFNEETNESEELVIYVDKETGIWMHTETTYEDTVTKHHITSVKYEYENPLKLCDPVVIPEQTVYNSNGVIITAKNSDTVDPKVTATLVFDVNNTTQSDIKISSHRLRVNGLYLGQNVVNGEVKAGSNNEITVKIPATNTAISDIYTIKDIDVKLKIDNVHTETTPDGSYIVTDSTLVEDTGDLKIKAECSEDFQQPINKDGTVVFNENNVKLTFKDLVKLDSGDTYFRFYAENDFSELIRIRIYLNKVNGVEFDDFQRFYMAANSEGFNGFTVTEDELSEFGDIDTIEIDYAVYYNDTNDGSVNYSDTITLIESGSPITLTIK